MINLGTLSLGELGDREEREEQRLAGKEPKRRRAVPESERALAKLIEETHATSRRVEASIEALHGGQAPSRGGRALLRDLARSGPQTVPQLARRRSVTRQHVQALVNSLSEAGWVELQVNPEHRRSRLVGVTERGRELISKVERRERELYSALAVAAGGEEMGRAAGVLRSLRESLEDLQG
ncbi:MAG: MarR family transcriptional regulator [Gemmatimonadetes bacterium]|nr:MarR family transcriptional regulator [Gemmatimonadota bacterium]NIO31616.1 MarR family transcriptional regulator [Gemmatimonadota bacterium]